MKRISWIIIAFILIIGLFGCSKNKKSQQEKEILNAFPFLNILYFDEGDSEQNVNHDISLLTSYQTYQIEWTSNDPHIKIEGDCAIVTQSGEEAQVTLTAKIIINEDLSQERHFYLVVPANDGVVEGNENEEEEEDEIIESIVPPSDYGSYYDNITATEGVELVSQLQTLVTGDLGAAGSGNITYGEVRYLLERSDININNNEYLWGAYDGAELIKTWDGGATWNREHVWPQSRLNSSASNDRRNIASDPHNIRAIKSSTNGSKSDRFFVSGSGEIGYQVGTDGYYPGDPHRGDVARILLYMAVRYRGILTLVDTQTGANYSREGANFSKLSLLLQWHLNDLPDEFERQRNNEIYQAQGNRNPFIDNPNYFKPVWKVLMIEEGLSVALTQNYISTIKTYENLKTMYIPQEKKIFI